MNRALEAVDPELRSCAQTTQKMLEGLPGFSRQSLPALRDIGAEMALPPLGSVPWSPRVIRGSEGNPDVLVYVINARPRADRGGIVFLHGGGFVTGAAKWEIRRLQEMAVVLDCTIVSVEYRLAPETSFEGSVEDNYTALRWTHRHAVEIGMSPERIVLLGESAGGGHAALLATEARDRGEVPVSFQCLVYPALDDRTGTTRAVPPHLGAFLWTAQDNEFAWRCFLGREPGDPDMASGVPGRETDLRGLPPAWIGVGGLDLLVQENIAFASRLIDAAVPTELLVVPGAFHGFDNFGSETSLARRFTASKLEALRRAVLLSGDTR